MTRAQRVVDRLLEAGLGRTTMRRLTKREVRLMGYDQTEMELFPIKRLEMKGAFLDFEEGPDQLWILYMETERQFQKQGRATLLLKTLYRYARGAGKTIIHGAFTPEGESYLKPVIGRLEKGH